MAVITEQRTVVLHLPPSASLSDAQLFELCQRNRELRIERNNEGSLIIMAPAGWESSARNAAIVAQLHRWARQDGTGVVTDSSGGYILPTGAMRAPDAAWVRKERLQALSSDERLRFPHLVPDFVLELRSPTDPLGDLLAKMEEYRGNGVRLGLLLDPTDRTVRVYRLAEPGVEVLHNPDSVAGDPVLPGFELDLREVW